MMTMTTTTNLAEELYGRTGRDVPSDKALRYLLDLVEQRDLPKLGATPEERRQAMTEWLRSTRPNPKDVSGYIGMLLQMPRVPAQRQPVELVGPGVYELDGTIYVVKHTRDRQRLYAKRVVESAPRMTEDGEVVGFDLVYAPGAIRRLRPEHRMTAARAEHFHIRYGRCLACGRTLKRAESVQRGVGPVCDPYGTPLAVPVVWADRLTDACPRCGQHVNREVKECPLALDGGAGAGGQIENRDLAHHCGQWLPVLSQVVEVDITADDAADRIEQAARELDARWREELQRERNRVTKRLVRELRWAMDALSTPLDEGEDPLDRIGRVTDGIRDTGEQTEPGLYLDPEAGAFVAWDYDPADPAGAELLEERVDTVTYGQAATMLGISRQRVSVLVAEGKLDRGEDGRVSVASVLARMREAGQGRPAHAL